MIFRALFGVLLFFCGIVLGAWLIFRFRRRRDGITVARGVTKIR